VTTRICMQPLKWLSVYFHGADETAKCLFACNQLSQLHIQEGSPYFLLGGARGHNSSENFVPTMFPTTSQ
jgi:hypothetical protein